MAPRGAKRRAISGGVSAARIKPAAASKAIASKAKKANVMDDVADVYASVTTASKP